MVGVLTDRAESVGPTGRAHMDRTLDRQLIARLQASDETAVAELAERYGSRIYQLALRHMKNREDAEEVAQDVLMKVYRKVGAFRGDAALSSWIYRITFNTAMSRLRNSKLARLADQERERALAAHGAGQDQPRAPRQAPDWSHMPDEEMLRSQLRQAVTRAILELPEIYRAPVVLRDIQGLTTEEASSRLRLKDQTLKSRLHRGRLMLRERLRAFTSGLTLHRPTPVYS
jgi:RNA polymerase sigma-70 factor, ECF subfamily